MALYTNLAFVTVMEVKVLPSNTTYITADVIDTLDCLTISNITQEGPRKEVRGGLNATPCIRYGKTMRLEMEDVVMRMSSLESFFDVDLTGTAPSAVTKIAFTDTFAKPVVLVGKTYTIDKTTGNKSDAWITFFNFLPDSVTDIMMESEGDVGTVKLAGELFAITDGGANDGKFFEISDTNPIT